MPELMPPLSFYYLALVDLINRPKVFITFVQEDTLKDVIFEGDWGCLGIMIHLELVLVVRAVKGHLNLLRVLVVRLCKNTWV
jgi:hypothetical protein